MHVCVCVCVCVCICGTYRAAFKVLFFILEVLMFFEYNCVSVKNKEK